MIMAPRRPVIGIPADRRMLGDHPFHAVGEKYIRAIHDQANATPLVLPSLAETERFEETLSQLDGLFFTGSPSNVEPHHYRGEPSKPGTLHDVARDATTLPLIRLALAKGLPMLGVCRGFQEMNVAFGGSLWQELSERPGLAGHHEDDTQPLEVQYAPAHAVNLEAAGLLHRIAGVPRIQVNSLHHQGVRQLGGGLVVEARADDGLIEAFRVEAATQFALAVQWHPEWQAESNPFSTALFAEFGAAARAYAATARS